MGPRGLSWVSRLGLHRRVPHGFRTSSFHRPRRLRDPPSYEWGNPRCAFPTSPGVGVEGGHQALELLEDRRGKDSKQKTDTHFIFPSFNLKQKRHRGSKIKIPFPPSQTFTPALPLQPPLPPQQGLEKGRCRPLPLGGARCVGGEGGRGGCLARCPVSFQI